MVLLAGLAGCFVCVIPVNGGGVSSGGGRERAQCGM